jgi:ribosomal protein S18 acetylase RimI-like enzyme
VSIRRWKKEDLPQVNGLLTALAKSIGFGYHGSLLLLQEHYSRMERFPNLYSTFVYTIEDDRVAGMISVIYYESVLHRKGTALVNELVVDHTLRRRGIGGELLSYCVRLSFEQGYDEIEVGVEKTNLSAITFYKRHGLDKEYLLLGKEFEPELPA